MKEQVYPELLQFIVLDDGLHARFCLDGVLGPVFGNEQEGFEAVKHHEKDVRPAQVESMALAVETYTFGDFSQFPEKQRPKSFIIRADGEWMYPPGEGESLDLSPLPATDDKVWDTIKYLEGSQTVH